MRYLILLFLVFSSCAQAQELLFEQFTTEEGLPSNDIYNLHQDKKGYIWVFTDHGAVKYNGSEFLPVLTNIENGSPTIYSIAESKKGELFVADSKANIYKVRNDSAIRLNGLEKMSEKIRSLAVVVYDLQVDDSLNIYVYAKMLTFKLQNNGGGYKAIELSQKSQNSNLIINLYWLHDRLVPALCWNYTIEKETGSEKEIIFPDKKNNRQFALKLRSSSFPNHIHLLGDDYWLSFHEELVCIKKSGKVQRFKVGDYINNFCSDMQGNIWISCFNKGLYKISKQEKIEHYLDGKTINDVLFDYQGGLWASTTSHGLIHIKNPDNFALQDNDLSKGITLLKKFDSTVFIGTSEGRLFRYNKSGLHKIPSPKYNSEFMDIELIGNAYYFSNFSYLLQKANPSFSRIISAKTPLLSKMEEIHKKNEDTAFFFNVKNLGFFTTKELEPHVVKLYDSRINDILFFNSNRRLLVATDKGLYVYHPLAEKKLSEEPFRKIFKCMGQIFLLKNKNDLYLFDTILEKPTPFHPDTKIPDVYINEMRASEDSEIYICTNRGLYSKKPGLRDMEWRRLLYGNIIDAVPYEKNLLVNKYNTLLLLKHIHSSKPMYRTPVYLRSVRSNNESIRFSDLSHLGYQQNSLEFDFEVLDFMSEKKGLFYKLQGSYEDSGFVKGFSLKLLHLRPGSYYLTVYSANNPQANCKLLLNIIPPFWETGSFLISASALGLLLIALLIFMIIRRSHEKEKRKQETEKQIAEYKITALKAQINPHFMSNSLSSLQLLIMENKTTEALNYLARFSRLLRMILDVSDKTLVPLETEIALIRLNIELEGLRFTQNFTYEIEVDPAIDPASTFIPPLIEQPVIENAIWHGLIPSKRTDKKLHISFHKIDNSIQIQIENNGIGYVESVPQKNESKGLKITRERLHQINRMYPEFETFFNIKKSQTSDPDSGTQVIFVLPLILVYDSNY